MSAFEYIAYKVEPLDKEQTILKLERFKEIDKYRSFYKILPAVAHTLEHERDIVTTILETSCKELIKLFKAEKKAHKASIKKAINDCMKMIAAAQVSNTNKDFAYEMCWYLSDIAGLDMRRASATNSWGYWDIILNEVKVVQQKAIPARKRKDKGLQ
jgi:hypothetical protein